MTTPGFVERLGARAAVAGITLAPAEVRQLETYFQVLARWNARMNLTALPLDGLSDRTVDRLFVEPLAAAHYMSKLPIEWLDVGSGGGSPAIPLKVLRPDARLTMVESRSRKAAFLREAARALNLPSTHVQSVRFEDLELRDSVDVVTVRAVRADATFITNCRQSLRKGGELLLFQSTPLENDVPGFVLRVSAARLTDAPAFLDVLTRV